MLLLPSRCDGVNAADDDDDVDDDYYYLSGNEYDVEDEGMADDDTNIAQQINNFSREKTFSSLKGLASAYLTNSRSFRWDKFAASDE